MKHIEKRVVLNVPLRMVYDQWTQFEHFPLFMPSVLSVQQLDERHVFWRVGIWGREAGWVAQIHEQKPDQYIAWHSIEGRALAGTVTFNWIYDRMTSVTVTLDYQVKGLIEWIGDALGAVESQVEASLKHFREFVESRPQPTGSWRGEIQEPSSAVVNPVLWTKC